MIWQWESEVDDGEVEDRVDGAGMESADGVHADRAGVCELLCGANGSTAGGDGKGGLSGCCERERSLERADKAIVQQTA